MLNFWAQTGCYLFFLLSFEGLTWLRSSVLCRNYFCLFWRWRWMKIGILNPLKKPQQIHSDIALSSCHRKTKILHKYKTLVQVVFCWCHCLVTHIMKDKFVKLLCKACKANRRRLVSMWRIKEKKSPYQFLDALVRQDVCVTLNKAQLNLISSFYYNFETCFLPTVQRHSYYVDWRLLGGSVSEHVRASCPTAGMGKHPQTPWTGLSHI